MLLYIFLVLLFVGLIIFFAIISVKKKNPKFVPPQVKEEPALNKLDNLVDTVKKKPQESPQEPQQQEHSKDNEVQETKTEKETTQEQTNEDKVQKEEKKKIGSRGTPPKKPPTINLKEAMKSKQFLDRKH